MIDVNVPATLQKGTLLIIETGEYSDRNWGGPVRMLKNITMAELAEKYRAEWKPDPQWPDDKPSPNDFLPWLIKAEWAEDVKNVVSWHVGSYGEFEP